MDSRAARTARGWVVGAFATFIAAASHAAAGGGAPSVLAIACGLVFAGMLGTLAMGRRPSLPRLVVAAGGSQLAFHAAFAFLSPSGSGTASAGHAHGVVALADVTVATPTVGATMWVAHAIAAVATIAFLHRAERALWAMFRDVLTRVVAATPRPVPVGTSVAIPLPIHRGETRSRDLAAVLTRRGPPVPRFG